MRLTAVAIVGVVVLFGPVAPDGLVAHQPKSQWDGVFTREQANRGEPLYTKHCSSCHNADLTGDEYAPPLRDREFSDRWNDNTLDVLFDLTLKTMPQNSPGSLTRQQVADVLAYVFDINRFPAGETEIPTQPEALAAITLVRTKPGAR